MIPVTFLTGFYVSEVVRRYWDQFMSLPFPDELALKVVTHVPGKVYLLDILRLKISNKRKKFHINSIFTSLAL